MENQKKIKIQENGPYIVPAGIPLEKETEIGDTDNNPLKWEKGEKYKTEGEYHLCRCGKSHNKPFCDGTHQKEGFDGTETASKKSYDAQSEILSGPGLDLKDAPKLCAGSRFCHRQGGTWDLTEKSDNPKAKKLAIEEACNCSSGRLTAIDKETGKAIDPEFAPSISVTEDDPARVSGPLWVKGGIAIESSDGTVYEPRNRQTICRCGHSRNKPFCDGTHLNIRFNDKK
jgi:CDGSH-type Zn-finger protein